MTNELKLVGYANFERSNPLSDLFDIEKFLHVEFWCGDASNTATRFSVALGMPVVAKSDQSTGNQAFCSIVTRSDQLTFTFSAPYSQRHYEKASSSSGAPKCVHPGFTHTTAHDFLNRHGLGVRAVALLVSDAVAAYEKSTGKGAKAVLEPTKLLAKDGENHCTIAEVSLYGDVVLRFVSKTEGFSEPFDIPGYEAIPLEHQRQKSFGLTRLDHAVGNVPDLLKTTNYIASITGFHEFAEFTAEDVGTVDSGLNSMVLANNNESVLLPVNEPTTGTRRKSQIQTYLDQNEGPGLQHLALKCDDIFHTLTCMRESAAAFEFMPRPSDDYYRKLSERIGDSLTAEQYKRCEELGILADKDPEGVLLQIFTKPVGDRATLFLEIIQRVGCPLKTNDGRMDQKAGCGGFGKGNFAELFKSIENYETALSINATDGPDVPAAKKIKV